MKDYYSILGIIQSTEPTVIKAVYKALMMIYHPDRLQDNKDEAIKISKDINEAYSTLSDPVTRKRYDNTYLSTSIKTDNLYSQDNQLLQKKILDYQLQLRKCTNNELTLQHQINEQKKIIQDLERSNTTLNTKLLNCQRSVEEKKDYFLTVEENRNTLVRIRNEAENILDDL